MGAVLSECFRNLKPYRPAFCKLPKIMMGTFGRKTIKHEIEKFNCLLNDNADGLRGNLKSKFKNIVGFQ